MSININRRQTTRSFALTFTKSVETPTAAAINDWVTWRFKVTPEDKYSSENKRKKKTKKDQHQGYIIHLYCELKSEWKRQRKRKEDWKMLRIKGNYITIHPRISKLLWWEGPTSVALTVTISKRELLWSDECANVCIYALQLIAFTILNRSERVERKNTAYISTPGEKKTTAANCGLSSWNWWSCQVAPLCMWGIVFRATAGDGLENTREMFPLTRHAT